MPPSLKDPLEELIFDDIISDQVASDSILNELDHSEIDSLVTLRILKQQAWNLSQETPRLFVMIKFINAQK